MSDLDDAPTTTLRSDNKGAYGKVCFVEGVGDKSAAPRTPRSHKKGRKSSRNSAIEDRDRWERLRDHVE